MSRDLRRVGKFRRIGRSDKSPACTGSSGFATEEIRKEDLQREDVEFLGILKLFLITYHLSRTSFKSTISLLISSIISCKE